ncbi:hypothetical protein ACFYUV_38080 [Nonomuraea sp. NPDC003560]|uniref:hypothetical protein n=1 Tax=Nonomuraea sp. NPDC003560 TaxID=3364341 RepID=UPI0036CBF42F
MTSRRMARALRAEAELLEACGDEQEALQAAKALFEEDPTEETLAERRAAMQRMRQFRGWIRAVARIKQLRQELTRDLEASVRAAIELEIKRLEADWGPLIAEIEAMQSAPPPGPGDAAVHVQPVRGRGRTMRPGGA